MLADERRQNILSLIQEQGAARTADLARRFKVSDQTIRRDLVELEERGLISKGYGGGVLITYQGTSYRERAVERRWEKELIAKKAVSQVRRGMTVVIGPGTTTEAVAQLLNGLNIRVVTNSLPVARAISSPETRVSLTGGHYRQAGELVTGAWTDANLEEVFADLGFIGVSGVDREAGYTVTEPDEALVLRRFIRVAKKAVVVADSSKFHRVAKEAVAPLGAVHLLITDAGADREHLNLLEQHGVEVKLVAETSRPAEAEVLA